ncbi:MAG: SUF system NifU family Fe-S cluster assembly protein [Woeseiaceae bacterium]|nr:SUF system NifU family Fe-S cluster assembly protein [Woeseiaceae bacterium]
MSNAELRDLYRELILDHSRKPRHFGRLADATHMADGINPLCGDKLRLYLRIGDGKIESSSFEGTGCAISVASASLMTDAIVGLPIEVAENCFTAVTDRLTGGVSDLNPNVEKIAALEGVRDFPSRVKCATLAWHALHAALNNDPAPATTE